MSPGSIYLLSPVPYSVCAVCGSTKKSCVYSVYINTNVFNDSNKHLLFQTTHISIFQKIFLEADTGLSG